MPAGQRQPWGPAGPVPGPAARGADVCPLLLLGDTFLFVVENKYRFIVDSANI